ncbi:MAG: winged helix DNA-binding domain-containing protein, partial [Actinocrinis sp.]
IGAVQSQYWPAVATAFAGRLAAFDPADLHAALERRELLTGPLVRATLHVSSARDHALYAAVTDASGVCDWRRTTKDPLPEAASLRELVAEYARSPRTRDELAAFIEDWLAAHPGAIPDTEADRQRQSGWRPVLTWPGFTRVGRWDTAKGPETMLAAPVLPNAPGAASPDEALDAVVRAYLRAFGPAGADDITQWLAWKVGPVRASLVRLAGALAEFEDESGRTLYDLPDAERPDADVPAPARLLPWFDSTLLAYTPARRQRILPEGTWDRVYRRVGLRIDPTFLVDGFVSGLWSLKATARAGKTSKVVVTLAPFGKLGKAVRDELAAESERVHGALYPGAAVSVTFEE